MKNFTPQRKGRAPLAPTSIAAAHRFNSGLSVNHSLVGATGGRPFCRKLLLDIQFSIQTDNFLYQGAAMQDMNFKLPRREFLSLQLKGGL
ncbi:MAG: hypothetical protein ACLFRL_05450, partial [Desulfohalobiaceae bacterium]